MSILDASQCISKVRKKIGKASTGAVVNFFFIILNALVVAYVLENCPHFMQFVIGTIIIQK